MLLHGRQYRELGTKQWTACRYLLRASQYRRHCSRSDCSKRCRRAAANRLSAAATEGAEDFVKSSEGNTLSSLNFGSHSCASSCSQMRMRHRLIGRENIGTFSLLSNCLVVPHPPACCQRFNVMMPLTFPKFRLKDVFQRVFYRRAAALPAACCSCLHAVCSRGGNLHHLD
jgi:hypothetical protein